MRAAMVVFSALALACANPRGEADDTDGVDPDTDPDTDTDTEPHVADLVTIGFSGIVVTVAGEPFGWTSDTARTLPIAGSFTYDRNAPRLDDDPADTYTVFDLGGEGAFTFTLDDRTFTQSIGPFVEIAGNTFRFIDGTEADTFLDEGVPQRVMSLDGVQDAQIGLWTAFVADDVLGIYLPAAEGFWFLDQATAHHSHTFSITDGATGGTLLMGIDEMHVGP